nr:lamin tail domain-containing protein 1 isoform X7 [Anser cygnoides]
MQLHLARKDIMQLKTHIMMSQGRHKKKKKKFSQQLKLQDQVLQLQQQLEVQRRNCLQVFCLFGSSVLPSMNFLLLMLEPRAGHLPPLTLPEQEEYYSPLQECLNSSAQLRDGTEIPDWEPAPPRNLSLPLTVSRQRQDYFSPLPIDSGKIAQNLRCIKTHGRTCSAYEDYYQNSASSAVGNVKIAEVDPDGHFIKILNCAPEKEENIGNYVLKQDIQGQPVAELCFPPETRMGANSTVTAVSWYTPLYWNGKQGWLTKEESGDFENVVVPTFSTAKQKEEWEEKQEFTVTDKEWKRADSEQTRKKGQSFIKREKKTFACLFPNQSAWCQSPDSPTHPHFSLVRPLTLGNDGSSLCRQSRCQSSRPDPVPGTLYAGISRRKDPSVPSCERGQCRRRPTRSARPYELLANHQVEWKLLIYIQTGRQRAGQTGCPGGQQEVMIRLVES